MNFKETANIAVQALLDEVNTSPKPGLVDRVSNGAHRDMSYSTFVTSINAIAPYLKNFAEAAYEYGSADSGTLAYIRPIGIKCEEAMLSATGGVNTHKGAIFTFGILLAAYTMALRDDNSLNGNALRDKIFSLSAVIAAPVMNDFKGLEGKPNPTHGEKLYLNHGITGIRGEAALGYPSIVRYSLPALDICHRVGSEEKANLNALLHLIANTDDTNLISRGGIEGLEYAKNQAVKCIELGGAFSKLGMQMIGVMDETFTNKNLSPGGSADLLSASLFIYYLTR